MGTGNENPQFCQKHEILEQPGVSPGPGGLLLPSWLILQPLPTWALPWKAIFKNKRRQLWDVGLPGRRSICTQTRRASATGMFLGGRLSCDDPEEEVASGRWTGGQREFHGKRSTRFGSWKGRWIIKEDDDGSEDSQLENEHCEQAYTCYSYS